LRQRFTRGLIEFRACHLSKKVQKQDTESMSR